MLNTKSWLGLLAYTGRLLWFRPSFLFVFFGYVAAAIFFLRHVTTGFSWPLATSGWGVGNFFIVTSLASILVSYVSFLAVGIATQIETSPGKVWLPSAFVRALFNTIRVFPLSLIWAIEWAIFTAIEMAVLLSTKNGSSNLLPSARDVFAAGVIVGGTQMAKAGIKLNAFLAFPLIVWKGKGIAEGSALAEVLTEKYSKQLRQVYWPSEWLFWGSLLIGLLSAFAYQSLGNVIGYIPLNKVAAVIQGVCTLFGFAAHAFSAQIATIELCLFILRKNKRHGDFPSLLDGAASLPLTITKGHQTEEIQIDSWSRQAVWARVIVTIGVGIALPIGFHEVLKPDDVAITISSNSGADMNTFSVQGYNYMQENIFYFKVNGAKASNVNWGEPDGGGETSCCAQIPGKTVRLKIAMRGTPEEIMANVPPLTYEQEVDVPPRPTAKPKLLEVHFFSKQDIKLRWSDWPGPPLQTISPSLEYLEEEAKLLKIRQEQQR